MYLIHVDQGLCKGCHICIGFCPRGVLEPAEGINQRGFVPPKVKDQGRCTGCSLCEMMCPDFAIAVDKVPEAGLGEAP